MRFVIAALIAWAALGTDFDKLNRPPVQRQAPTGEDVTDSRAAPSSTFRVAEATSVANVAASEEAIEPPALHASPGDKSFCEALKEAAEASEIPLPFFARLLWQESRFQSSEVSP